jgi:hypothetical protein
MNDIEISTPPPARPAATRVTEVASLPPKPHQHAERTAELDAAIYRWRDEYPEDLAKRVFGRLEEDERGCWVPRRVRGDGPPRDDYATVRLPEALGVLDADGSGAKVAVHRVVWMLFVRPIPYGMVLDHDGPRGCHNKRCCRPEHVEVTTNQANVSVTGSGVTAQNAERTQCPAGHLLDGPDADLRANDAARGERSCRRCHDARNAVTHALRAAAMRETDLTQRAYGARHGRSLRTYREVLGDNIAAVLAEAVPYETLRVVSHGMGEYADLAAEAIEQLFSEYERTTA